MIPLNETLGLRRSHNTDTAGEPWGIIVCLSGKAVSIREIHWGRKLAHNKGYLQGKWVCIKFTQLGLAMLKLTE